eukprot:m.83215 g.83215  ORF g.83215 m.83215 type:complete len:601 (-) comp12116_c0_seq1:136-1938(-)
MTYFNFLSLAAFNTSAAFLLSIALHFNGLTTTVAVSIALFLAYVVSRKLEFYARILINSMVYVFFRSIGTRNSHCIPAKGPILFVCGPHSSQFVDPILVMTHCPRNVRFLIAAKSMKRAFVGTMSMITNSIPISRPQDYAFAGTGTVKGAGTRVLGTGTKFTEQFDEENNTIYVRGASYRVENVVSDTELLLKQPLSEAMGAPSHFKVFPRIDHSVAYEQVYKAFGKGECVGIFPEGGSHDRPELLPLKAGVALMALGYMSTHKSSRPVRIIPVGINYFHGHRFRSRALLDYGLPIEVTPEMVEAYCKGGADKRGAVDSLMKLVQGALDNVTITAEDYETLQFLWAMRRMYKPQHKKLSMEQTQQLTMRFLDVHALLKDDIRYLNLKDRVQEYNETIQSFHIRDHQVAQTVLTTDEVITTLFARLILFVVETVVLLPFFVFGLPVLVVCRIVSARKAKVGAKKSAVKLKGRDLVATWKILTATAVIPTCWSIYVAVSSIMYSWRVGLFLFVTLPLTMLISLRIWDHYLRLTRSFFPLYVALNHYNEGKQLLKTRNKLKRDIRQLISEISEKLEKPRMFSDEDFAGDDDDLFDDEECEECE